MKTGTRAKQNVAAPRVELGRYIVADPAICHGKLTFKGTRIFVSDILVDVERGLSWDSIIERWGVRRISKPAIAEAVRIAREALFERTAPDTVELDHAA